MPTSKKRKNIRRNRSAGIFLIVFPIVLIIGTVFLFAFVNALLGGGDATSLRALVRNIINFVLTFFGLIGVIGIMVGIPVGIVLLIKKEPTGSSFDKRSGEGKFSTMPKEIDGWNWGAAGLTWIWGIYHRVWISLLVFVPLVNLFFFLIVGRKGNEWAWRKTKWESVEQFKKSQKKWVPVGIAFFIVHIFFSLIPFSMSLVNRVNERIISNKNYTQTSSPIRGARVKYHIDFDEKKWSVRKNLLNEDSEYEFTHKDGDVYAFVIPERIQIPLDSFPAVAIINAKKVSPNATITYNSKKIINGKEFLILQIQGDVEKIPFVYYGYYYAGEDATIQFVTFTSKNLFPEYKYEMKELLNGINIEP